MVGEHRFALATCVSFRPTTLCLAYSSGPTHDNPERRPVGSLCAIRQTYSGRKEKTVTFIHSEEVFGFRALFLGLAVVSPSLERASTPRVVGALTHGPPLGAA